MTLPAAPHMLQQINLIEPALRIARDWLTGRAIVGTAAALGLATAAHFAFESTSLSRLLASEAPKADIAAGVAPLVSADEQRLRESERLVARGTRLIQAMTDLTNLPRDNAQRLRSVVSSLPDNLWLQELEFSGMQGLRVSGGATDAAALARFTERLGTLKAFQGVPLQVFRIEPRAAPVAEQNPQHYGFVLSTVDLDTDSGAPQ